MNRNQRAWELCQRIASQRDLLRVGVEPISDVGGVLIDCGLNAAGGLAAGRALAEVCLAGLAKVDLVPGQSELWPGPAVAVWTDAPLLACLGSQYAGWRLAQDDYFAMGSGPMRAAGSREPLIERLQLRESAERVVGVLETSKRPPPAIQQQIAVACDVPPEAVTLLIAPTASQTGAVQIVARSVETALHKLLELGFDVRRVESGYGVAPLPPVAADDLAAIGRANDAILYGGEVTLWVRGDDETIVALGPKVPSSASPDFGEPFADIFERYHHDFYQIDPLLFSPAVVTFANLDTGRTFRYGHVVPRVIHRSFGP